MMRLFRVLVCFLLLLTVGCQDSSVKELESTTARAEQRLETLRKESSPEAIEAKVKELSQREKELAAEKLVLSKQLEGKLGLQGWSPLTRVDGIPTHYFRIDSVENVEPDVVWLQTMTLSPDSDTQELIWVFAGMKIKLKEETWVTADKPSRAVSATDYKPVDGKLEDRALVELTKFSNEK